MHGGSSPANVSALLSFTMRHPENAPPRFAHYQSAADDGFLSSVLFDRFLDGHASDTDLRRRRQGSEYLVAHRESEVDDDMMRMIGGGWATLPADVVMSSSIIDGGVQDSRRIVSESAYHTYGNDRICRPSFPSAAPPEAGVDFRRRHSQLASSSSDSLDSSPSAALPLTADLAADRRLRPIDRADVGSAAAGTTSHYPHHYVYGVSSAASAAIDVIIRQQRLPPTIPSSDIFTSSHCRHLFKSASQFIPPSPLPPPPEPPSTPSAAALIFPPQPATSYAFVGEYDRQQQINDNIRRKKIKVEDSIDNNHQYCGKDTDMMKFNVNNPKQTATTNSDNDINTSILEHIPILYDDASTVTTPISYSGKEPRKVKSSKQNEDNATIVDRSKPNTSSTSILGHSNNYNMKATWRRRSNKLSRNALGPALNTNGKPRAPQGSANDPQSIAARTRRERINARFKTLQDLVPNASKFDLVTMLEKAIDYVKFLQHQLKVLSDDELWKGTSSSTMTTINVDGNICNMDGINRQQL